jgi:aromatic-L-amino-acid decarboxylase
MYPLEPSAQDQRAIGEAALAYVLDFLAGLPDAPATTVGEDAETLALRFRERPPDASSAAVPFDVALDQVRDAAALAYETAGPGYLAYIPGGGLFVSAIADLIADGVNRFVDLWHPAPGIVQLEWNVVRWVCDLFDYPAEARGVLTSGGSMANLSAIVAARRAMLPEDFLDGRIYASEQVHASVPKAAAIGGFPPRYVRAVPTDALLRMDVDALRTMVAEDREAGLQPFLIVASAGTTNTGAIDPLDELADVAEREGMWLHVDAAYGGFFQLTGRGRERFAGIDRADSITLDPHKGMFLPYGTGCLLVRNGSKLREAHLIHGDYLQDMPAEGQIPNFTEYSPELSRDIRGLRVWLPLKVHGVQAFRDALDEKLDLAELLSAGLRGVDGLDVPWDPQLTVVPFRLQPEGASEDEGDALTQALLDRVNASRRVFMSSTLLAGRFWIRPCILSHRTHRDRMEEAIEIVAKATAELLAGRG